MVSDDACTGAMPVDFVVPVPSELSADDSSCDFLNSVISVKNENKKLE